jgi:hypothetical protein
MNKIELEELEYEFIYMVLSYQKTLKFNGIQSAAKLKIMDKVKRGINHIFQRTVKYCNC